MGGCVGPWMEPCPSAALQEQHRPTGGGWGGGVAGHPRVQAVTHSSGGDAGGPGGSVGSGRAELLITLGALGGGSIHLSVCLWAPVTVYPNLALTARCGAERPLRDWGGVIVCWDKGDKGDFGGKGDFGDIGNNGIFGDFGDKGNIGDFGDTGNFGDSGDFEDIGDFRNTGDKGDLGDIGNFGDTGNFGSMEVEGQQWGSVLCYGDCSGVALGRGHGGVWELCWWQWGQKGR